jgi:hypothetical protein
MLQAIARWIISSRITVSTLFAAALAPVDVTPGFIDQYAHK